MIRLDEKVALVTGAGRGLSLAFARALAKAGAAVIVIRNGQVLFEKGYGLANLETRTPIRPDTAFLLASLTKQFTAMAVMMLAERGKIRYEDPLTRFFPHFPLYAQKITVRHLLNHTAGFPEYDDLWIRSGKVDHDWPRSSATRPSTFEPTSRDALNLLAQQKSLDFDPGEKWKYSDSGYVILAQIVEKASGTSFGAFLEGAAGGVTPVAICGAIMVGLGFNPFFAAVL